MHATRQWQETGHISPQMLNKWPKPMCGKRKRTNVRRKKIFMEVNLQINKSCSMWQPLWMLSHVGVSLTVICYDYRGVLTYISSLCDISDVCSHITFLPNTSVEPLSEKKKPRGRAMQRCTEPFQEFKLHPLMLAGSTSWETCCHTDLPKAPFAFLCPPNNIPVKIIYD